MSKKMIDADALEKLLEWIVDNEEYVNDFVDVDGDYVHAYSLKEKIQELATPAPEPKETCKSNLTKFSMQLFEAIGQNSEAGKLDISDDDFDKMETIAFKLIDAMNLPRDTRKTEILPQESIFDADGWCWNMLIVSLNIKVEVKIESNYGLCIKTNTFEKPYTGNGHLFKYLAWRPLPTIPHRETE